MTSKILQIKLDFYLFADDKSLLLTCKTIKEIKTLHNLELKGVTDWLKANELTHNIDKSNLALFRRSRKEVTESIILKFDKTQIKEKEHIKYLGVLLDNHLSWGNHINYLKINKRH